MQLLVQDLSVGQWWLQTETVAVSVVLFKALGKAIDRLVWDPFQRTSSWDQRYLEFEGTLPNCTLASSVAASVASFCLTVT